VRINGKCPAGVTSRNIPPHRPPPIRQGLSLRQVKPAADCALHLIESTRARIVQGEHANPTEGAAHRMPEGFGRSWIQM
jgi:hypothetical protein